MWYQTLANTVVVVHLAFVGFVLIGLLLILLGIILRWDWVRNFWFRAVHLLAIGIVAVETMIGMACPLTIWENQLREAAGQSIRPGEEDFVGYWANRILFLEDVPQRVLNTSYILVALMILAVFLLAPPHWPRRRPTDSQEAIQLQEPVGLGSTWPMIP
jgi:hypothetical protein